MFGQSSRFGFRLVPLWCDHAMKRDPPELLKEALELPPEVRAALAGSLLESLDDTLDPDVEAAWEQEITRRIQDLNGIKMKPIPWSEARRLIVGGNGAVLS